MSATNSTDLQILNPQILDPLNQEVRLCPATSFFGLWYFGMLAADAPRIVATMQAVRDRLWVKTEVGGVARYENDYYHRVSQDIENVPGNPWFICTLWLALVMTVRECLARRAEMESAGNSL